ncbi:hypothetical protein Agub_g7240, partial [Astrephomene gubernaculifera]
MVLRTMLSWLRRTLDAVTSSILSFLNPSRRYLLTSGDDACKADLPCFDLAMAVPLAVLAFDAYSPPTQGSRPVTHSAPGTAVTCLDEKFLKEVFRGAVEVQVLRASKLRNSDAMSLSDPFAVVSVGICSCRTTTVHDCLDPVWDEHKEPAMSIPVGSLQEDVLKVQLWDEDRCFNHDLLGEAAVPLRELKAGREQQMELQLSGPGAKSGSSVVLRVRLSDWSELSKEQLGQLTAQNSTDVQAEAAAGLEVAKVAACLAAKELGDDACDAAAAVSVTAPAGEEARRWRELSELMGEEAAVKDVKPLCYLDNPRTGTQGWIHRNKKSRTLVVAFRGTEPSQFKDVLSDLRLAPVYPEKLNPTDPKVRVHAGFLSAYESVRPTLLALVAAATSPPPPAGSPQPPASGPWRILVTGHSLGGALATLGSYDLKKSDPARDITCYTFGAPRVGNDHFASEYDRLIPNTFRVTNKYDIVVSVPRTFKYTHVGRAVQPSEPHGDLQLVPPALQLKLVDKLKRGVAFSVSQHMGTTYQTTLGAALRLFQLEGCRKREAEEVRREVEEQQAEKRQKKE